jgi:SAM-dependent methyltransferase
VKSWLAHPLTRGLDLDDPRTTALRRQILRDKPFLRKLYLEWYRDIAASLPAGQGAVLELGSGAGFLAEVVGDVITSDIQPVPGVDLVADALALPFGDGALRAIVMTNLLHHLSDVERFLGEAARCVRVGGVVSMIEPWVTPWSKVVYAKLHHEPFDPAASTWRLEPGGPLSSANSALPWIVFERDRQRFSREAPAWEVERIRRFTPFRYLVSGGVSLRSLMPGWTFGLWGGLERALGPAMGWIAMFAHVVLRRVEPGRRRDG